eukprot:COSAG06_NODE_21069_length_770_cov_2.403875_1_plen_38_part_10
MIGILQMYLRTCLQDQYLVHTWFYVHAIRGRTLQPFRP